MILTDHDIKLLEPYLTLLRVIRIEELKVFYNMTSEKLALLPCIIAKQYILQCTNITTNKVSCDIFTTINFVKYELLVNCYNNVKNDQYVYNHVEKLKKKLL